MEEQRHDQSRHPALDYHEFPKPGKLEIRATKPLANGRDLSRAYSPGVAEACLEIKADPSTASRYTSRRKSWRISSARWSRPLVQSTLKTSRHPIASSSRSSAANG